MSRLFTKALVSFEHDINTVADTDALCLRVLVLADARDDFKIYHFRTKEEIELQSLPKDDRMKILERLDEAFAYEEAHEHFSSSGDGDYDFWKDEKALDEPVKEKK